MLQIHDFDVLLAWPCDLETLARGFYRTGERKRRDYYSIVTDEHFKDEELELLVRVDDGEELPGGMERAYFRQDGSRVVGVFYPVKWL